jgi:hypothetical protein
MLHWFPLKYIQTCGLQWYLYIIIPLYNHSNRLVISSNMETDKYVLHTVLIRIYHYFITSQTHAFIIYYMIYADNCCVFDCMYT